VIVSLTLNPSLDRTFVVERLVRGGLNRATRVRTDPAGKGVNVSKALHANGVETLAVLPIGGASGAELLRLLKATGIPAHAVSVGDAVRANVSVVETDGTVTKLNEPGPSLTATEIESLVATALKLSRPGGWLVASGSLPVGAPTDTYASIAERAAAAGVRFALDSSGAALATAVAAGPSLIKPNLDELRELTAAALPTLGDVILAMKRLLAKGVGQVLVSLGPLGAVLSADGHFWHGKAVVDEVRNTVGAGDALLAGTLAGGNEPRRALATGLAWAGNTLRAPGTTASASDPADFATVSIADQIDQDLQLDQVLNHVG
jgi:1-phosphofructokinase